MTAQEIISFLQREGFHITSPDEVGQELTVLFERYKPHKRGETLEDQKTILEFLIGKAKKEGVFIKYIRDLHHFAHKHIQWLIEYNQRQAKQDLNKSYTESWADTVKRVKRESLEFRQEVMDLIDSLNLSELTDDQKGLVDQLNKAIHNSGIITLLYTLLKKSLGKK